MQVQGGAFVCRSTEPAPLVTPERDRHGLEGPYAADDVALVEPRRVDEVPAARIGTIERRQVTAVCRGRNILELLRAGAFSKGLARDEDELDGRVRGCRAPDFVGRAVGENRQRRDRERPVCAGAVRFDGVAGVDTSVETHAPIAEFIALDELATLDLAVGVLDGYLERPIRIGASIEALAAEKHEEVGGTSSQCCAWQCRHNECSGYERGCDGPPPSMTARFETAHAVLLPLAVAARLGGASAQLRTHRTANVNAHNRVTSAPSGTSRGTCRRQGLSVAQ